MNFDLSDIDGDCDTLVVDPIQVASIIRADAAPVGAELDWFRWAPIDGMIAGQVAVRVWWLGRGDDDCDYIHRSDVLLGGVRPARVHSGDVADDATVRALLADVDHAARVSGRFRRQRFGCRFSAAIDAYEGHLTAIALLAQPSMEASP